MKHGFGIKLILWQAENRYFAMDKNRDLESIFATFKAILRFRGDHIRYIDVSKLEVRKKVKVINTRF